MNNHELPTSSTPPLDVLKILLLQRRDAVLEAIESYYKQHDVVGSAPTHFITSRVRTLFFDVEPMLRRYYIGDKEKDFEKMSVAVLGSSVTDSINAFRDMNNILDAKNLTKWDNMRVINTARVENENEDKGL
jgi:hypothetical protein